MDIVNSAMKNALPSRAKAINIESTQPGECFSSSRRFAPATLALGGINVEA